MVWKIIKKKKFFFFFYFHIREVLSHSQEYGSRAAFLGGSRMIREVSHVWIALSPLRQSTPLQPLAFLDNLFLKDAFFSLAIISFCKLFKSTVFKALENYESFSKRQCTWQHWDNYLKDKRQAHNVFISVPHLPEISGAISESPHDKPNKLTCVPSEDSDQPGHPPSLIRLCCPYEERLGPYLHIKRSAKTLLRLDWLWPGWFESSLVHISFCWFCHEMAHLVFYKEQRGSPSRKYQLTFHFYNLVSNYFRSRICTV